MGARSKKVPAQNKKKRERRKEKTKMNTNMKELSMNEMKPVNGG